MPNNEKKADKLFLLLLFILVIFGLIMLASASAPVGYANFGDTYFFIKKQILLGLIPGVIFFIIAGHLNFHIWRKLSWLIYFFSLVLLLLVFVPGVGMVINGSRSWIHVLNFSFQPSEFAKLALVIILSMLLTVSQNLEDWKTGLLPILAIVSPILLIVGAQDVGTLSILLVIVFLLLYLAGVKKTYLLILGLVGVVAFSALLLLRPYRVQRLTTFLHPELDPKGQGYQINQAFLAAGSGGAFGFGLGNSRQKYQYLPEVQSDSVFAVIAEEMGFIVSAGLIVLISFLGLRGFKIAKGAPDQFGRLLASGIMIWFLWQSLLNISAIIGLMPLTGVPLPFISHGGSALLVGLTAFGIVANISKESKI